VNSFQWGTLILRLGALALYASLPVWLGSTLGAAVVAAYEAYDGDDRTYAIIGVGHYAAPAVVTWLLAGYFRRRADHLIRPVDVDPESASDAPRPGEELLTAGIVLFGAYLLVARSWTPFSIWHLHYDTWMQYGSYEYYNDGVFDVVTQRWAAVSLFEFVAALFLIFAGRRIASRLCARDGLPEIERESIVERGDR
jgi:hypothetical protein